METNPYQTPEIIETVTAPAEDAEAIRRAHIKHEAQVKSIGTLYWIGAFFMIFGIVGIISAPPSADHPPAPLILCGILVIQIIAGWGLRRLKPWARIVGIVLSVVGLFAIPVGTIISLFFLLVLASKKSGVIFSKNYQAVIAATPHVKYKTSKVVWIALGLILLVILGIAAIGFLGVMSAR